MTQLGDTSVETPNCRILDMASRGDAAVGGIETFPSRSPIC